jgi:toxin ParE1/3/4
VKVALHPAAEAEIADAAAFYARTASPAVAAKFVAEIERVARVLAEFPALGAPRRNGRRGFGLSIFPYTVIYRAHGDRLLVLVVKHDARRPGYGSSRT